MNANGIDTRCVCVFVYTSASAFHLASFSASFWSKSCSVRFPAFKASSIHLCSSASSSRGCCAGETLEADSGPVECTDVTEVVSGVKASARRMEEETRDDSKEEGVVRRCLCECGSSERSESSHDKKDDGGCEGEGTLQLTHCRCRTQRPWAHLSYGL